MHRSIPDDIVTDSFWKTLAMIYIFLLKITQLQRPAVGSDHRRQVSLRKPCTEMVCTKSEDVSRVSHFYLNMVGHSCFHWFICEFSRNCCQHPAKKKSRFWGKIGSGSFGAIHLGSELGRKIGLEKGGWMKWTEVWISGRERKSPSNWSLWSQGHDFCWKSSMQGSFASTWKRGSRHPQLLYEAKIYKILGQNMTS